MIEALVLVAVMGLSSWAVCVLADNDDLDVWDDPE